VNSQPDDFAEMAISLHQEPTFDDTVDRVLEFALKAVDCAYAGVIFVHGRRRIETIAATDPLIAHLDGLQAELNEGPDVGDEDTQLNELIDDSHTEHRWPTWTSALADAGIRSMLGARLYASETTIGSLNLYDPEPHRFDQNDRQVADVLARHAAIAIDTKNDSENLWRAIDARKVIGQAQGILMERHGLDADQAFAVLRRYSQDNNTKLRDVAVRLIDSRRLPS
jgi:GAF domain-containing protein